MNGRSKLIRQCPKCSWYSLDGDSHLPFCPDDKPRKRQRDFGFDDPIDLQAEEDALYDEIQEREERGN